MVTKCIYKLINLEVVMTISEVPTKKKKKTKQNKQTKNIENVNFVI